MPRPTSIVLENDFPLDDDGNEDSLVEPFPVVVQWHDLSESPTQAVARLNGEAVDQARKAQLLQRRIDVLAEFELRHEAGNVRTTVTHAKCGAQVASLHGSRAWRLDEVWERVVGHDCSVKARLNNAGPASVAITRRAIALLAGDDTENTDAEYLRGLTEMVMDAASMGPERKGEVAAYLWETADTTGEPPAAITTW